MQFLTNYWPELIFLVAVCFLSLFSSINYLVKPARPVGSHSRGFTKSEQWLFLVVVPLALGVVLINDPMQERAEKIFNLFPFVLFLCLFKMRKFLSKEKF